MPEPISLATIAATISAMIDLVKFGKETYQDYLEKRKSDPLLESKVEALRKAFSTYSKDEIEAIHERLDNCRKRFIDEGDGKARSRCLCSVLTDVRDGNGGNIPVDEWENAYSTLNCAA